MLPTNNINCCSVCDCVYKVSKPFDDVNRRNRRIDRLKEDPERAATITRYGWTGVIASVFCIVVQIVMFFLTNRIVEQAIQDMASGDIKQDFAAALANLVVAPMALVTFVCGVILGFSGFMSGIIYGKHQKRLNDQKIGKVSTIFGLVCLVVMIAGVAFVLVNL